MIRESDHLMEQLSPTGHIPQPSRSLDDLPMKVACTLSHGSNVTSMDFHPSRHTLLLVGSANGEFTLWEIGTSERLVTKPFEIWDMQACSTQFQGVMAKDSSMAVNRVTWSPDGDLIGVASTKHLIHLHVYRHPNKIYQFVEIEAHSGGVNDIVFSRALTQLCVVTCGDDKLIRVWDMHGQKIYSFEGHTAPVYSICPHHIEQVQFITSTSVDGKMKTWLYDNLGSRLDFDVPGKWCSAMLYSADGTRLFSCGTSKEGDTHLVEWNQSEGFVERSYSGFRKKPSGVAQGVVQFDTARNHILAAGEDNQIKFWDVDDTNMLACIEAGGGLPSYPRLRFNKEGNLLAVTTVECGFKILANTDGLRSLPAFGNVPSEVFRSPHEASEMKVSGPLVVGSISPNIGRTDHLDSKYPAKPSPKKLIGSDPAFGSVDKKLRISEEKSDKAKPWELKGLQQFCVATMPETDQASKVSKVLDDDNLLREIIIRVGFPTTLVHAALVCKRWYQHASEPAFLRLFRERHPPCLLGFYLENREDENIISIRFIPMLPQPSELARVIRTVESYSWGFYHGAPANFLCSRKGKVLVNLYNKVKASKFTTRVHSPLCPESGLAVVPPLPHIGIRDDYYFSMNDLLLMEEADGVTYIHVLLVANTQRTKYTVLVQVLRHGDGVWRTYLALERDQILDPEFEPRVVLANNKIYIASTQSSIDFLDLTTSSISEVQLPQGVEYGDKDTMLAPADDDSGVYLIHAKNLQLDIWLHKGDNWLLVDTISLRDMIANLRIPGCEVEDEPTAPLWINHVGPYADFVFLEMGRCALHLDVKCMQLRKVYDMTEEELDLGDIHPLTMIWPPIFPALEDNPARNDM
ncbi:protein TPR1-like [Hordeum vulgare subsp. vulgare]|nr:protein TPR1-like [Hordeum vulgare subsp. vulgare]